jgi:hypothetical protein
MTGHTDSSGRPIRSHVERRVYEPEAAVIREIYQPYAAGAVDLLDKAQKNEVMMPRRMSAQARSVSTQSSVAACDGEAGHFGPTGIVLGRSGRLE